MDYGLFIEVNSKGINTVDSQLKNLNKTMDDTAKKSDRVEQGLNPQNVNRFTQSVRGANTEVSALNKSLNTISTLVASGMFLGMARSCITAAQEVASLKAQIRVLGEEVDSTYQNLKEFSLTTAGLDTQGVVKAYASFRRLNYSTEESKSNIEALGKGLASFGTTNGLSNVMIQMEQLANRTSGFTQDLNAISNYLMDARAIVKEKYGVSDFYINFSLNFCKKMQGKNLA